jgi:hypothetical protein
LSQPSIRELALRLAPCPDIVRSFHSLRAGYGPKTLLWFGGNSSGAQSSALHADVCAVNSKRQSMAANTTIKLSHSTDHRGWYLAVFRQFNLHSELVPIV